MSLTIQLYTMLSMIGMGAWIGASLDTYQRFLKRQERKRWIVFIHDILFWIVQALFVFYVLLLVNEAELRIYVFLALLCGFAAYQSMLKAIYMRLLNFLIYIFVQTTHFFCSNYTATHDKTCYYYSAAIYCIYIILISYTAFNWTCVMENGDLDITFHMESFFSGLFDLLLRSYGNFSLIVLNFL